MPSSKDIRQSFISFFQQRGHKFVPSSSVVPIDDPTLLFTNAGMNQFKNIFLGSKDPECPRAVNSQKCIRAGGKHNDLEEVGTDGYHHTFFEMLGNWSFGDYYKQEAILWAWELLTDVWLLPKDKLYATVHHTDQEAHGLWTSITDIDPAHVSFHGDKDNFWEMGDTGPCGPCSEIHIDRGAARCDKQHIPGHICQVNGDCARYIELWNLVFIQYYRAENRELTPLKSRFVDTGAGLERITQVLQDKDSNYETDLFTPIIARIGELSGKPYTQETGVSHRVVADHIRCLCFALADGGFPSNEGRGYVLRRILRRAARHGRLLGFAEPFMHLLVDTVVEIMGHHFQELEGKQDYIKMVIRAEEERFNHTLDNGLERFDEICARVDGDLISGKDAFMLYDTYGFPLDLTLLLAREKNFRVDTRGFEDEMQAQRERARKASKFTLDADTGEWLEFEAPAPTVFVGYDTHSSSARVQRYRIMEDGTVQVVLDRTPFYAESGGQVADTGRIFNADFEISVNNARKAEDAFVHYGTLMRGALSANAVTAEIDSARRLDIARNHTATHLVHKALSSVLGAHVQQKGSLVAPDHMRFDFTHVKGLSAAETDAIENIVNIAIRANRMVSTESMDINSARAQGAVALFGEKYGETVRVVSVKDFSKELCGGTHVLATGELGLFKIVSESSSAAGIRRIEAVTGRAAMEFVTGLQCRISSMAAKLHVPENAVETKIEALQARVLELETQIKKLSARQGDNLIGQLLSSSNPVGELYKAIGKDPDADTAGWTWLAEKVDCDSAEELRGLGDQIKDRAPGTVAVLFAVPAGKVSILCVVGKLLLGQFHAGKIAGAAAAILGGKGGGRPDSAMAGGGDAEAVPQAIAGIPGILASML